MGYTAKELVAIAEGEVGYHEKASNANLDSKTANSGNKNYQKYGRDLNKAGYYNGNKNGYEWCDQFTDWCFYKLTGSRAKAEYLECQTGVLGAGCTYSMQYYKNAGRLDMQPKIGDQIFFRYSGTTGADHTGIVVSVTNSKIVTIEGNKNDKVSRCEYSRSYKGICGYGHPRYDAEGKTTEVKKEANELQYKTLKKGSKGGSVKALQILLIGYGYSCGKSGVDGSFGGDTLSAVNKFQDDNIGTHDGIVGIKTWRALLQF